MVDVVEESQKATACDVNEALEYQAQAQQIHDALPKGVGRHEREGALARLVSATDHMHTKSKMLRKSNLRAMASDNH